LNPSMPNPFGRSTLITYSLPEWRETTSVDLSIFDPAGRLVRTLVDHHQQAGMHAIVWDGKHDSGESVAAGVYLCRLRFNGETLTSQIVLIR
jgi:flagellar hook assembly protein FlgD